NVNFSSGSGFFGAAGLTVMADFVMSQVAASCPTNGPTVSGQSQVSGLLINGQPVTVTGEANQTVALDGGNFVVINEQLTGQTETTADIAVNALHIVAMGAGANVVIGSSAAGFTCGAETNQPSACGDFAT